MKAIVVRNFNQAPKFETDFPTPTPKPDEVLINVTASSLSNRARSPVRLAATILQRTIYQ